MKKNNQVCTNCVMDTTDSQIVFDENGVCDHCLTFEKYIKPHWCSNVANDSLLFQLATNIRKAGKGKSFDCIIGMSGGIDSSYLVYVAKELLGLRPLVFHVDAGWNSQQAVYNIEKIVDTLNLDLFTEVINWEQMRRLQLAYFKAAVPHIDTPQDHAFFATMYKFSNKYGVKHILTGGNYSTECIRNPLEWMYYQSDASQIKDIYRKHGDGKLNCFPLTNVLWHKFYLPYIKRIKLYRPLDFIEYKKDDAVKLLQEKFDYQTYAQKHFESRFTRFYESYWLPKKFGFDTRKVQFSSLILTGQMTRDVAMELLTESSYDDKTIHDDISYIANKLEIHENDLLHYFELPNKTFRDYKNQAWLYDFGAKLLRYLGVERGGKR